MISRREFIKGASVTVCATNLVAQAASRSSRPNILIIITDEQSSDAASYRIGHKYINTPNMDSVAANGMVFTRAYCASPLCVPSRTSMFTGQYPTVTGVLDNTGSEQKNRDLIPHKFPIMGKIFQEAGYETGYFGKWHLPSPENKPELHGFATLDIAMIDSATAVNAAAFIRQKHSAPFLVVASLLNPHNICDWARGVKLPLGDIGEPPPPDQCPPLRPNHGPQKDEPDIMTQMRRSYQAAPMFPVANFDDAKWRQYEWAYYRLIEKVDAQVGIVMQALRDSGHEKDTLVVMLADHGDCQGAHGWNQKTVFYEESAGVPFVVSHPGVIAPGTSKRLVNTGIDLIPTLCHYAGIAPPGGLPGLSLKDAASDPRKYIVVSNKLSQGAPIDGPLVTPIGRMIRGQRYKYCAYSEGHQRESLVDLEKDPGEMTNLAVDSTFHETLNAHRAMLTEWCETTHDTFPVPDGPSSAP